MLRWERSLNKVVSILGTTAVGKSSLAIKLAREINGEIISCDSMQIYQGLAIGTGHPNKQELAQVKHHLINEYELSQNYDASIFVQRASALIEDICQRGKVPIVVGGTGLYARLLLYKDSMRSSNKIIAKQIRQDYEEKGFEPLYQELMDIDPATAGKVGKNTRRLFRALEVIRIEKKPFGKSNWKEKPFYKGFHYILLAEPSFNRQLIIKRIDKMLEQGWEEEAKLVLGQGLLKTPTAWQALGYRIINMYLDKKLSYQEMREQLITATCRYAKRQRTWFRHQHSGSTLLNIASKEDFDLCSKRVIGECEPQIF